MDISRRRTSSELYKWQKDRFYNKDQFNHVKIMGLRRDWVHLQVAIETSSAHSPERLQQEWNVSPFAQPPLHSLLSNSHVDKPSFAVSSSTCLPYGWVCVFSTYQQQKDVSELCSHSRYWWGRVSGKSLISILKTATAFDKNSVIVIATNSLQVCSSHAWGDPGNVNWAVFISRKEDIAIITKIHIPLPNPHSSSI